MVDDGVKYAQCAPQQRPFMRHTRGHFDQVRVVDAVAMLVERDKRDLSVDDAWSATQRCYVMRNARGQFGQSRAAVALAPAHERGQRGQSAIYAQLAPLR